MQAYDREAPVVTQAWRELERLGSPSVADLDSSEWSASSKDVLSCRKSHLPPSFALTQAVLEEASELSCSFVFHMSKEFWGGNDPGPRSHTRSGVQSWAGPGTPASQGRYSVPCLHPADGQDCDSEEEVGGG